jgi:hypothetical protein
MIEKTQTSHILHTWNVFDFDGISGHAMPNQIRDSTKHT